MTLANIKTGMIVWAIHRERMGHTTLKTVRIVPVKIVSVKWDIIRPPFIIAKYEGRDQLEFSQRAWSKWRIKKPTLIENPVTGHMRLATRAELKAMKKQAKEAMLEDR